MTTQPRAHRSLIQRFYTLLTPLERWFFIGCTILILGSGAVLGYRTWLQRTTLVPALGGSYTEGIVASSLADVTPTLDVLTKLGLTQYDSSGAIVPAVADHWDISSDAKTYTFYVRKGIDLSGFKQVLNDQKNAFPDIGFTVSDDGHVVFQLKQPYTPFLASTTQPLFPYGPFVMSEQQKGIVRLKANPNSLVGQPHLHDLVLRIYPDSFNLTKALERDEINGVSDITFVDNERLLKKLDQHTVTLPRKIFVFFNTDRDVVKSVDLRRKLKNHEHVDGTPSITLVTLANPHNEHLAQQVVNDWSALGVHVIVETHTATELAQDFVPNRKYDALIYGLDFGADPDPYPFWHSSQIGTQGLNLSNFANIDADRLLEKARQTQDEAERTKLYAQFQEIFDREVPAIELEHVVATFAVSPKIHGVNSGSGVSLAARYALVKEWYRKTHRVPTK